MKRFVKMFNLTFVEAILIGSKRQTVRPVPRRIPEEGDLISLRRWAGQPYRSKQVVIGDAMIESVRFLTLYEDHIIFSDGYNVFSQAKLNEFAENDGFDDWQDLVQWFKNFQGLPFTGILIEWGPLKKEGA